MGPLFVISLAPTNACSSRVATVLVQSTDRVAADVLGRLREVE